jgi:hypothetical protein
MVHYLNRLNRLGRRTVAEKYMEKKLRSAPGLRKSDKKAAK